MAELRWVFIILLLCLVAVLKRLLGPGMMLVLCWSGLALIGIAMTIINLLQAWKRDRRFLSGFALGGIQLCVGAALLMVFTALGVRWPELPIAIAVGYLCGGHGVLIIAIVRARRSQ